MSNNNIKKRLKQKFNYVKSLGYNILYLALKGSQNYNLALEDSDIDCIAIVIPSLDYMISGRELISNSIHLDNKEQIAIVDIRKLPHLIAKQDVGILESLVTDYIIINKCYQNEVVNIINMVDDVVENCGINIYNALFGMMKRCFAHIIDEYEVIEDDIFVKKYSYNPKNSYQVMRIYQLMYNIYNGMQYKYAIKTYTDNMQDTIMKVRRNELPEEQVRAKVQLAYDNAEYIYTGITDEDYVEKIENKKDVYYKKIYEIIRSIMNKEIKDVILEDESIDHTYININLDRYKHIYFTADTHFGHTNIMKYTNREFGMNVSSIEEHDEQLINMWNNIVKDGDLVFILGDLCLYGPKKAEKLLNQLNGDKVLIKGNHDTFVESNNFDKTLFKYIDDYMEINYKGQKIMLMHYPINSFKHMCKEDHSYLHFFGHIHNSKQIIPMKSCNVGVDVNNYKLISISDAIEQAKTNIGNQWNN